MRLLAVKLDHIGDFALALPALKAAHLAGAQIDVVISPCNLGWKEIVPWIRHWYLGGFTAYLPPPKTFKLRLQGATTLFKLNASLPLEGYDVALDLRMMDGDWRGKFVTWLSRAPVRVGSVGTGSIFLTTEHTPHRMKHEDRIRERIESAMKLPAGIPDSIISVIRPAPSTRPPRILIHPGSNASSKNWPLAHWIRLVQLLPNYLAPQTQIIVIGGAREKKEVEAIESALEGTPHESLSPPTLKVFAETIARSDLLVGLDSAPPHIARLVGTPAITLFSGAAPSNEWAAKGDNTVLQCPVECSPCFCHICRQPVHACMEGITPERVLQTIIERMQIVRPEALR